GAAAPGEMTDVGRDHEPPACDLVADDLRRDAFAGPHAPHLHRDDAPASRFELCHVALPSAGITRVRFEGSAGASCPLSRRERGGSPSVCARPTLIAAVPGVKASGAGGMPSRLRLSGARGVVAAYEGSFGL